MKTIKSILFIFLMAGIGSTTTAQEGSTAIGLRAAWGFAVTGKHFIAENTALEGIVQFRSYNSALVDYSAMNITGLYEIHQDLGNVDGLKWYYGGGAYVGFWSGDYDLFFEDQDSGSLFLGVAGVIGLDYRFANIPLNLSLDWMPNFGILGSGSGFTGESGGLAIRYILN